MYLISELKKVTTRCDIKDIRKFALLNISIYIIRWRIKYSNFKSLRIVPKVHIK